MEDYKRRFVGEIKNISELVFLGRNWSVDQCEFLD